MQKVQSTGRYRTGTGIKPVGGGTCTIFPCCNTGQVLRVLFSRANYTKKKIINNFLLVEGIN